MFRILTLIVIVIQPLFATPRILIGIAGGTGSGKTTLAQKIKKAFPNDSVFISQDSYYKDLSHLPIEERAKTNFDHPDSLDFTLMETHLLALMRGESIRQPLYSFHIHTREKETIEVQSTPLIIVEGILLFSIPKIRDLFDLKIYVDTDDDIRVLRRIERDMKERSREFDNIRYQYLSTVKPMHDQFVEPSKQFADIIVPRGGHNDIALNTILSKIKEDLTDQERLTTQECVESKSSRNRHSGAPF